MFRYTKAECCICDFASTVSNLISLIFTASHGQSLVVCNDFSYKSKVVVAKANGRIEEDDHQTSVLPDFSTVRHIIRAGAVEQTLRLCLISDPATKKI